MSTIDADARRYRKSAQAHAMKALKLLAGQPGLSQDQQVARLQHAAGHLATAMAHASAAVALAQQGPVALPVVDIDMAVDDIMSGLEDLLTKEESE